MVVLKRCDRLVSSPMYLSLYSWILAIDSVVWVRNHQPGARALQSSTSSAFWLSRPEAPLPNC